MWILGELPTHLGPSSEHGRSFRQLLGLPSTPDRSLPHLIPLSFDVWWALSVPPVSSALLPPSSSVSPRPRRRRPGCRCLTLGHRPRQSCCSSPRLPTPGRRVSFSSERGPAVWNVTLGALVRRGGGAVMRNVGRVTYVMTNVTLVGLQIGFGAVWRRHINENKKRDVGKQSVFLFPSKIQR